MRSHYLYLLLGLLLLLLVPGYFILLKSQNPEIEIIFSGNEENLSEGTCQNCSYISLMDSPNQESWLNFSGDVFYVNLEAITEEDYCENVKYSYCPGMYSELYPGCQNKSVIVVLGDSYSEGAGVERNETFSYFLNNLSKSTVLNLAHGGFNTRLEVESLEKVGLLNPPKYVILQFFDNDYEDPLILYSLWYSVFEILNSKEVHYDKYQVAHEIYDYYGRIFFPRHKAEHIQNNIMNPLMLLDNLSLEYGFKVIFLYIPSIHFEREIMNFINSKDWIVLDIKEEIGFKFEPPFTLSERDLHFSKMVHRLVAKKLYSLLNHE